MGCKSAVAAIPEIGYEKDFLPDGSITIGRNRTSATKYLGSVPLKGFR
jgi:hypothetical protein